MKDRKVPTTTSSTKVLITNFAKVIVRFSRYLSEEKHFQQLEVSKTVLLLKINDKEDLKNYCPKYFLSQIYKLLAGIITSQLARSHDE